MGADPVVVELERIQSLKTAEKLKTKRRYWTRNAVRLLIARYKDSKRKIQHMERMIEEMKGILNLLLRDPTGPFYQAALQVLRSLDGLAVETEVLTFEDREVLVKKARQYRNKGHKWREIARKLGVPSKDLQYWTRQRTKRVSESLD